MGNRQDYATVGHLAGRCLVPELARIISAECACGNLSSGQNTVVERTWNRSCCLNQIGGPAPTADLFAVQL